MRHRPSKLKSQAVFGLALVLLAQAAIAGSFSVRPTRLVLNAEASAGVLTVTNSGSEETVVQVQPNVWSQESGSDVLERTDDLIAVPPLFSLQPGDSQVVRIGLRRPPVSRTEQTYRVLLREVPPAPSAVFNGLQVALTLSLPVFAMPPGGAEPVLNWALTPAEDDGLELRLSNEGDAHVQLMRVTLRAADGQEIKGQNLPVYLLPGQSRAWPISADAGVGSQWELDADTDAGPVEVELVVQESS